MPKKFSITIPTIWDGLQASCPHPISLRVVAVESATDPRRPTVASCPVASPRVWRTWSISFLRYPWRLMSWRGDGIQNGWWTEKNKREGRHSMCFRLTTGALVDCSWLARPFTLSIHPGTSHPLCFILTLNQNLDHNKPIHSHVGDCTKIGRIVECEIGDGLTPADIIVGCHSLLVTSPPPSSRPSHALPALPVRPMR